MKFLFFAEMSRVSLYWDSIVKTVHNTDLLQPCGEYLPLSGRSDWNIVFGYLSQRF